MKQLQIRIIADINDADYFEKTTNITKEDIDIIRPLCIAIKNFKPYTVNVNGIKYTHSHNFPLNNRQYLKEKSIEFSQVLLVVVFRRLNT